MCPLIAPLGDTALVVRVGATIDESTRRQVLAVVRALAALRLPGTEVVPGFTTVTVHYDPAIVLHDAQDAAMPFDVVAAQVAAAIAALPDADVNDGNDFEIPVCYGGEFGPDLDHVASRARLSAQEVVERHGANDYRVCLLGFLPGFAYLGGLDPAIATPRRDSPRTAVAAGSVGIAGMQTGVYPLDSPGGWQLIGRSPLEFFDPLRTPPTLLAAGDRVRFRAIDRAEFDRLCARRA